MKMFEPGMIVSYKGKEGQVRFVDPGGYITVCLKNKEDGMISDVCLVVYPWDWENVEYLRHS